MNNCRELLKEDHEQVKIAVMSILKTAFESARTFNRFSWVAPFFSHFVSTILDHMTNVQMATSNTLMQYADCLNTMIQESNDGSMKQLHRELCN